MLFSVHSGKHLFKKKYRIGDEVTDEDEKGRGGGGVGGVNKKMRKRAPILRDFFQCDICILHMIIFVDGAKKIPPFFG